MSDKGENGISLLGITGYAIIEVRWSVRWSGYDRTGDEMVALDLEAIDRNEYLLPTCDDKGVFTDDEDTYRKHK